MTFKALMNLGGWNNAPYTPIERYHSGSNYHGSSHSKASGKGAGGSGAALSALTLLAFLFLINVMQQSLQENNSTTTQMTTAVLLRDDELPMILDAKEDKEAKRREDTSNIQSSYGAPPKSSTKNYVRLKN